MFVGLVRLLWFSEAVEEEEEEDEERMEAGVELLWLLLVGALSMEDVGASGETRFG